MQEPLLGTSVYCNGARARHLPNSAQVLPYSATCHIVAYCLVLASFSSPTTSALAARATYLFTLALATPFFFSLA